MLSKEQYKNTLLVRLKRIWTWVNGKTYTHLVSAEDTLILMQTPEEAEHTVCLLNEECKQG